MIRRVVLAIALAACGSHDAAPAAGSGSAPVVVSPAGDAGRPIALLGKDLPDPSWEAAARVALAAWRESFDKLLVTQVEVQPLATPGGAVVPHLMIATATDGSGKQVFRGVALVHDKTMINGGGPPRMAAYLQSIGFPDNKIAAEHLAEIVHITGSMKDGWIAPTVPPANAPPSKALPPKVSYAPGSATLELSRTGSDGSIERMILTFARDATFTVATP
ncbi:MAG TPA: hypothetical protein VFQ53_05775 [Kofleriaceae bacterium]|nr:hypothetical protein [Kofleriaceae bacterium]